MRLAVRGTALAIFLLASPLRAAEEFHFDFGPQDSPVAKGFVGVRAADAYSPQREYGWSAGAPKDFTTTKPAVDRQRWYNHDPNFFYDEMVDDLRRDGSESDTPLAFKVDLPPGKYRVLVTVGHLIEPRYSIDILANGKPAARKVNARHQISSERGRLLRASGYYRRVRFRVDVADKGLELAFKGDDAEFQRLMAEAQKSDPATWPKSRFRGDSLPPEHLPFLDIGGPYSKISLMGLEVFPDAALPVQLDPESLKLSSANAKDAALGKAIDAFNAGKFAQAEKAFQSLADPVAKGLGLLALAGRPEYEREFDNATEAVAALKQGMASGKRNPRVQEVLDSAAIFLNGLTLFRDRGVPPNNGPRSTWRAINELDQTQPDDPLYWKSQINESRYMLMCDPHQWAWHGQEARRKLAGVEKKFPGNRFVQFHLHGKWSEHEPDWVFPDYVAAAKGAPEWAASTYEAFNREVDLTEWWFKNRQAGDGSLGGGWGDDVETLRGFGSVGAISPDASPLILEGVRKVANGAWFCDEMDPEAGYFANVGDSEHTGEFTGDPLTAMIRIDYGNPLYLERAMKTGKLMRDVWMGFNAKGHFLMRSNFLGARGVGGPGTANDSRINYRPASPARSVYWYNYSPALEKLFVQWADAWLAASLSTDKGKPQGIVPEEIGYATSEIGGENAPAWHTADHPKGSVNSDWAGAAAYHDYLVDLLVLAYQATGDKKYLEPLRLEAEYAEKHLPQELRGIEDAKALKEKSQALPKGSPGWIAANLAAWPRQWAELQSSLLGGKASPAGELTSLADVAKSTTAERDGARQCWPLETTEALATDRIHWPGLWSALKAMSGFGLRGRQEPLVTYRGLGREFAAAVMRIDSVGAKVVLYNISPREKQAVMLAWPLELGAEYRFRMGPDADNDAKMDRATREETILLENRDDGFPFQLPGQAQYVVEIDKVAGKGEPALKPDLGISREDIKPLSGGGLEVCVHNVGSAASPTAVVRLVSGGKTLAEKSIGAIEPPLDFDPKTARIVFDKIPGGAGGIAELKVVLDPENAIREVAESNNSLSVRFNDAGSASADSDAARR